MKKLNAYKILYDKDKNEIAHFLYKSQTLTKSDLVLDETEYDESGKQIQRFVYRYDENGKHIETFEYDSINDLVERAYFELDKEGNIIKSTIEYSDGEKEIKEFEFINNDRTEKVTIKDSNNQVVGYEIYHNDGNGNIIEEIIYEEGNEISKYEKTYNQNKLIEEKFYSNSELEYSDTYDYINDILLKRQRIDNENNLIEVEENEIDFNSNVVVKTYRNHKENYEIVENYEYDKNNNVIFSQAKMNGNLVFSNRSSYSQDGTLLSSEILELDWNGYIIKNEKTYSDFSNNAT